tara:strand:+ start:172 stop:405 length:234 start_codon:yes stop_codon:yes gene_type:complete
VVQQSQEILEDQVVALELMRVQGQLVQEIHLQSVHLKVMMEGLEQKGHQAMELAVVVALEQLEELEVHLLVELEAMV